MRDCKQNMRCKNGNCKPIDGDFTFTNAGFEPSDEYFISKDENFTSTNGDFQLINGNFVSTDEDFKPIDGGFA